MLQFLPDSEHGDGVAIFGDKSERERKEDWARSKILLQTCTPEEILSTSLHENELLRRLFHEEGVIVYEAKPVRKNCRCSQERVENIIRNLSEDDREHAATDGVIEMTCEFWSKRYIVHVT